MATHWEVVGGSDSGGILVREGKELQSPPSGRLGTGSVVMQVEAVEDRVHYYMVMGDGPPEGWVSIKTKSSVLLKQRDITVERWFQAVREFRSKKKDPEALKRIAAELLEMVRADANLKGGLTTNGFIEAGTAAMKSHPADVELHGALIELLGNLCIFNAYACRKAGKAGIMELTMAYFKGNSADRSVQLKLADLGCFLDFDAENRQQMASLGGYGHCFDMCRLHAGDAEVTFAALCAASNPVESYDACNAAGAPEVLAEVLSSFRRDDKVRSEAGMVAAGLLQSDKAYECAVRFGQAGLNEELVRAMREHLGSRPMQANGARCLRGLAQVPENRQALAKAGGIDVLLAAVQENTRCPGFCWGLQGMEDTLWRVLDNCGTALMELQRDSAETRAAMVRAGAVEHLKAALQQEGPNEYAQAVIDVLEQHCEADPAAQPRPRASFEGRWIQNLRPNSGGIFTITQLGDRWLCSCEDNPDEDWWSHASFTVTGDAIVADAPEEARGLTGTLAGGVIHWPDRWFYPWQPLE
mmetsp:Transcript_106681/g.296925  ORF Transcript_106681/g.296925 Transcript_106681/m.296925 type:complete len:527 (+) Transcript_106681:100-1680(+)